MFTVDPSIFWDGTSIYKHRNRMRREVEFVEQVRVRLLGHVDRIRLVSDDLDGDVHDARARGECQKRTGEP